MPWTCAHTGDVHLEEDRHFLSPPNARKWFVPDAIARPEEPAPFRDQLMVVAAAWWWWFWVLVVVVVCAGVLRRRVCAVVPGLVSRD